MENCKPVSRCRACGSDKLDHVMHVGHMELANSFLSRDELGKTRPSFPLDVVYCSECGLAQLSHVVSHELLYRNYNYVSSTSKLMDDHLDSQAKRTVAISGAKRVLEIASNTGIALAKYKNLGCEVIGVDPAENISEIANRNGVTTIPKFFSQSLALELGKFDAILARHVFAHVDDWDSFAESIASCCHDKSVVVLEFPYVVDTIAGHQFDTIYHEHLSYISVGPVRRVFNRVGMGIIGVTRHPKIHGGSIEVVLSKAGFSSIPCSYERMEQSCKSLCGKEAWIGFSEQMSKTCGDLVRFISSAKGKRKAIVGYGASARGNTLLNACGIRNLDAIIDNTPFKIGKFAPGSEIPIVGPSALLQMQPDYAIVTAWTYFDEIVSRESEYTSRGGRFINPIPSVCQYL